MLSYINIKNIALIEELEIDFNNGLNIFTGETGVGKSIIINSINFALGGRVSKDFIRNGAEFGAVEVIFTVDDETISSINKEYELDLSGEDIVISRRLSDNGKNVCKINGEIVTVNILQNVTSYLIDVHGQHEHQSLMDEKKHIEILDSFCDVSIQTLKENLQEYIVQNNEIKKQLNINLGDDSERERKKDLLKFQIDEIDNAALLEDEEDELNNKRKIFSNSERIIKGTTKIYKILSEDESVIDQIGKCFSEMQHISEYDPKLSEACNMINDAYIQLEEVSGIVRDYAESIDHDEEELNKIEKRLDLIHDLKRKYGKSIKEILEYYQKVSEELDFLENSEEKIREMKEKQNKILKNIEEVCEKISIIRKKNADVIKDKIQNILKDLELKNAKFDIEVGRKNSFDKSGYDEIEFLFSANLGEKVKSLNKIASGGEMSRVMLAIKNVLADTDGIDTLIFDEIDTGISGITAQKVAEKMSLLSKSHQLICITHLPQIAAMADNHYKIEKEVINGKTQTNVRKLNDSDTILELARLITGAETTDTTLLHAREIKEQANSIKKNR